MTIRVGILGAAAIAPQAMIVPAREVDGVTVSAVAARDRGRACAFAEEHGVPVVEADYRSLCHSTEVDAVYVALPASHHRRWSIEALRAGKDVLCEKPIALNTAEAREMVAVANEADRLLMEAFHWRYHPLAARMKELVDIRLGALQSVSAVFTVAIPDRSNIRRQLELGGGSLMDLGCYPLQWVRHVVGGEPTVIEATAVEDPAGVDVSFTARLRFDHPGPGDPGDPGDPGVEAGDPGDPGDPGVEAEIHCSMADHVAMVATLSAVGSDGKLEVVNPLAPQRGNSLTLETAGGVETERIESASTYHHQLVAFRDAVISRVAPPTGGTDSIATMAAIDACYRAAGMRPRTDDR